MKTTLLIVLTILMLVLFNCKTKTSDSNKTTTDEKKSELPTSDSKSKETPQITSSPKSSTNQTYKIGLSAFWPAWSPLIIADQKGFWKELGIDVKVVVYVADIESYAAFEGKAVDILTTMVAYGVEQYMNGKHIKIISEIDWSNGGDKIIIKKGKKIEDFKGKQVGAYTKSMPVTFFFNKYIEKFKMKLSDFQLVEMEGNDLSDNFVANKLELIINFDPPADNAVKKGNGEVLKTTADFPGSMPEGMMMLKENFDRIPQEDLEKILSGWIKAVEWSSKNENWDEYKKLTNEKIFEGDKEAPYSDKALKEMLSKVIIHDKKQMNERNKTNGGLYNYLKELNNFIQENKLYDKKFVPEDIFENKPIMTALSKSIS